MTLWQSLGLQSYGCLDMMLELLAVSTALFFAPFFDCAWQETAACKYTAMVADATQQPIPHGRDCRYLRLHCC